METKQKLKAGDNIVCITDSYKDCTYRDWETPEEKCTLGYCDENGCMNRKRFLVEPEIESVNHPNHYGAYRDWETDRKSTRLNSSHRSLSRMPSSA